MTEASERRLVVNADDFGMSAGINAGIIAAHDHGIVTSTSLMVRWPAAEEAARVAATRPNLGVGLHLDIAEWVYHDGVWHAAYEVVPASDAVALESELNRQLARFRELTQCEPTHIDSHQHVHMSEPLRSVAVRAAQTLGIPLRGCTDKIRHIGAFCGQSGKGEPYPDGISALALGRLIDELPAGTSELGCHPGFPEPDLQSAYHSERSVEVATLCDAAIRELIARCGIALVRFPKPARH